MPEILTRYPEIAMKVLRSEGAQCGTGARPKILTKCPPDKFCTLAGGELCVYGPDELGEMTQLAPADVCRPSGARSSSELVPIDRPASEPDHALVGAMPVVIAIVAVGLVGLARRSR